MPLNKETKPKKARDKWIHIRKIRTKLRILTFYCNNLVLMTTYFSQKYLTYKDLLTYELWTVLFLPMFPLPDIGVMVRVFAYGPVNLGSIPGRVIPKTQKMVSDASLLNTQHYKVRIKGKVEQSRERSSTLTYTLVL